MQDQHEGLSGPTEPIDLEDLLPILERILPGIDDVPREVVRAAEQAYGWRTIDAELAALVRDSALDADLALVRGAQSPRLVTFQAGATSIEVEVSDAGGVRHLVGQVVPPGGGRIEIVHKKGVGEAVVDELGRFIVDGVAAGPVWMRMALPGDPPHTLLTEPLVL